MKSLAIIGGGIIGLTLANYIDPQKYTVTLYDEPTGQATSASAGIISPWLSKRRNKQWYALAREGAGFFQKLVQDFALDPSIYFRSGTLLLRPDAQLAELADLAEHRRIDAPEIGDIRRLSANETNQLLPLLAPHPAVYVSGGGRLDGKNYLLHLRKLAEAKGVQFQKGRVRLEQTANDSWLIRTSERTDFFDTVSITAGPGIKALLEPLGYSVDIRPQKGQLLVFDTSFHDSSQWPVAMLDGEADLIPFEDGRILLGATHENEAGWDLTPTEAAYEQLIAGTKRFLTFETVLEHGDQRVGTRAYTSDFAPFFGVVPGTETLYAASGLGSSGLTTGPYIGFLLAQHLNGNHVSFDAYQKPMSTYIDSTAN